MNNANQKKQVLISQLIKNLMNCSTENFPENMAYNADYQTNKVLSWVPSRQEFCRQLIDAINQAMPTCKKEVNKQALGILRETILGKLFYYSLQENHRYLVIGSLTSRQNKQKILKEVEIIESSPDRAILYLDALEHGVHRNFIQGILGCVYN